MSSTTDRLVGLWRRRGQGALEVLGLATIAFTQPVLDVFGQDPGTFLIRDVAGLGIVLFALVVALGPTLLLLGLEAVVERIDARAGRLVHLLVCSALGALAIYGIVRQAVDAEPIAYLVLLLVAELAMVLLWLTVAQIREGARYLSIAAPVFVVLFLVASGVSPLVLPGGSDVSVGSGSAEGGAPVVFIVFDELPLLSLLDGDGSIDAASFPSFARLASSATWFRNHTTVAPDTIQAVPAVVTGQYPTDAKYAIAGTYPESIFTALGGDHRLQAFEVVTKLCPGNLCRGQAAISGGGGLRSLLGEAVDVWLRRSSFDPADREVALEAVAADPEDAPGPIGERFVGSLAGSAAASRAEGYGEQRLDYLHLLLPHRPFQYLPSGVRYKGGDPSRSLGTNSYPDQAAAESARDRHLLQLQYADRILGDVLDEMDRLGTYDESAIVVTADHGASFTAGAHRRGVTADNWYEILWTPFLLKAPGQDAPEVVDEPTRSIDVVPTLLDVLDVEVPWELDGVSGFEPRPAEYADEVVLQDWDKNVLHPGEGEDFLTFEPAAGFAKVLASGPFGAGDDHELRVLRRGPYGDLVGAEVAAVPLGEPTAAGGRLDGIDDLVAIDPADEPLPLYRTGTLQTEQPVWVAVALDGRVAAVVQNQDRHDGASSIWVVLSDVFVGDGVDQVDLYLVDGEPGAAELRPIPFG